MLLSVLGELCQGRYVINLCRESRQTDFAVLWSFTSEISYEKIPLNEVCYFL